VAAHLGNAVRLQPRDSFTEALTALKGKKVAVDPNAPSPPSSPR
jgi:Xaa-Pro aminopeptidase